MIDPLVPFVLPDVLVDGMRMGAGQLRKVTAAANTDTTTAHTLGRVPHFVIPLDNGTGFTPQVARSSVTAWSVTSVTVQYSAAFAGWEWIV